MEHAGFINTYSSCRAYHPLEVFIPWFYCRQVVNPYHYTVYVEKRKSLCGNNLDRRQGPRRKSNCGKDLRRQGRPTSPKSFRCLRLGRRVLIHGLFFVDVMLYHLMAGVSMHLPD